MPKVTTIPATINPKTHLPEMSRVKRRVAGYARVSTDSDEQFTSFSAQTEYYKNLICSNPEWEFVHVYTDEGISGLNTRKRTGFKEMIDDALAGRIDLIITKSVSRFARNTVKRLKPIKCKNGSARSKVKTRRAAIVKLYSEKPYISTLSQRKTAHPFQIRIVSKLVCSYVCSDLF